MSLYALEARRNILATVFVVLTLAVREDVAAGLAVVGGLLLLTGLRPERACWWRRSARPTSC